MTIQPEHSETGTWAVPLRVHSSRGTVPEPITIGVPFPRGLLNDPATVALTCSGADLPLQTNPLAHWPDGTVKWLLLDFLLPPGTAALTLQSVQQKQPSQKCVQVEQSSAEICVATGKIRFSLNPKALKISLAGKDAAPSSTLEYRLQSAAGEFITPKVEDCSVESAGPVHATICFTGMFPDQKGLRFTARLHCFADSSLLRLDFTIHNPNRARHPGGLWDLGDRNAILFRELVLAIQLPQSPSTLTYSLEPTQPSQQTTKFPFEIYQDSSGGDNWQSRNHLNRLRQIPLQFRGFRLHHGDAEQSGDRATPTVAVTCGSQTLALSVPNFWQEFPKSIDLADSLLSVGLFPTQFSDLHELQPGEQKTHTVWLDLAASQSAPLDSLSWVHSPATVLPDSHWLEQSRALPFFVADTLLNNPLDDLLKECLAGPNSFAKRREIIDEYGWRNFGDFWADHEQAYFDGPTPIISHYNNQYDMILGFLLHYLRTGDSGYRSLLDPLARHVVDIDIYHTDQDKAAYNGGLFWHTDHYKDALTSSHRAYSIANQKPGQSYGGGPCNEHNYTTGLLHYYYLTGDSNARSAVLSLANWVIHMDDGSRNILRFLDSGPTGLASTTAFTDYYGPGRGAGNSINALLDGWLLTQDSPYLSKAEELIFRSVHPQQNLETLDLPNTEARWSYTVLLSVLGRFLDIKRESQQLDQAYHYERACLLHYADWMVHNEQPYFDHPDKLEYPTETWAAQELRKANVFYLAALHTPSQDRQPYINKAREFKQRAWHDLLRFPSKTMTRPMALAMVEGLKNVHLERRLERAEEPPELSFSVPEPMEFVGQKQRVKSKIKNPKYWPRLMLSLCTPSGWFSRK